MTTEVTDTATQDYNALIEETTEDILAILKAKCLNDVKGQEDIINSLKESLEAQKEQDREEKVLEDTKK